MSSQPVSGVDHLVLEPTDPGWAGEFEAILDAYQKAGGRPHVLQVPRVASAVISANHVLAVNEIEGVTIEAEGNQGGVRARIRVAPGTNVKHPVHLSSA